MPTEDCTSRNTVVPFFNVCFLMWTLMCTKGKITDSEDSSPTFLYLWLEQYAVERSSTQTFRYGIAHNFSGFRNTPFSQPMIKSVSSHRLGWEEYLMLPGLSGFAGMAMVMAYFNLLSHGIRVKDTSVTPLPNSLCSKCTYNTCFFFLFYFKKNPNKNRMPNQNHSCWRICMPTGNGSSPELLSQNEKLLSLPVEVAGRMWFIPTPKRRRINPTWEDGIYRSNV